MNNIIKIGKHKVGIGQKVLIIAEIGINHNGDINIAKKLIDVAVDAGCDAVKFQKRTVDVIYTKEELDKPRESPWGTTNREQKHGLEFGKKEYDIIDNYCKQKDILWFASCWDKGAVDFISSYNPPSFKIASASLTDKELLKYTAEKGKPILLSTGMSTLKEIDDAVNYLEIFTNNIIIMHCTSTYPSTPKELNLRVIQYFKEMYKYPIGYSGHEVGIFETPIAVVIGACVVERHITLNRAMYGSDQSASLEPDGLRRVVKDIRELPDLLGDGKKVVYPSELPIKEKLRKK